MKWKYAILTCLLSVGVVWSETVYVKNPDGTVQAIEVLSAAQAGNLTGDLSGRINQINLKIQNYQQLLLDAQAEKIKLQAALDSLINAQK